MTERSSPDLNSVLRSLRRRLWLVLGVALAAAALAFVLSVISDERYEATASLLFRDANPAERVLDARPVETRLAPDREAATNLALSSLDSVSLRVKRRLGSPLSVEELRERVDIAPQGQADLVEITASGPTARRAAELANAYAAEIVQLRREAAEQRVDEAIAALRRRIEAEGPQTAVGRDLSERLNDLTVLRAVQTGGVEIAEPAFAPLRPSAPRPLRNAAIGGVLGLLLGVALALLLARLDRRLESEEEAAEILGAPILARVPHSRPGGWQEQLFTESFQFLRSNLALNDPDGRRRIFAVTSPLPGDGKSTVLVQLAEALERSGETVLVVDCDLRRPTLDRYLDVPPSEGMGEALVGARDATDLVQQTSHPSIRLLAAGSLAVPHSASIFMTPQRVYPVLEQVRGTADYVLVDTSPVSVGAETSAVASSVHGVIVVLDANRLDRDAVIAARDQLATARAHLVGIVINRTQPLVKGQYGGYYGSEAAQGGARRPPSAVAGNGAPDLDEPTDGRRRRPARLRR